MIFVNPEPGGPVALNHRATVGQAEHTNIDRPPAGVGVSQDHSPKVPTARLSAAFAIAEHDYGGASFGLGRLTSRG